MVNEPSTATPDKHLALLVEEYQLTINRLDQYENRIIQILGTGVTVLGAAGAAIGLYQGTNQPPLAKELLWLSPMPFIAFFALVIYTLYLSQNLIWLARVLSQRINKMMPEPVLLSYQPQMPSSNFFSLSRGNVKQRLLVIAMFWICIGVCAFVMYLAWRGIYETSHAGGTLFLVVYVSLSALLAIVLIGVVTDLPRAYRPFSEKIAETGTIPAVWERTRSAVSLRWIFAQLIPRPRTLVSNCMGFIIGYIAALVTVGFQQYDLAYKLFYDPIVYPDKLQPPVWVILAIGAIYFFVEEILLQQAKHIWDDIRDIERDKLLPLNQGRAVTSGLMSINQAVRQMFIRWSLALVLGYLLGGIVLLVVFIVVSLHQIIYVLYAKSRGQEHPVLLVFFIAISLPLRFPTGVLAVTGAELMPNPIWLQSALVVIFLIVYFLSLGSMAAFWKMEAQYWLQYNLSRPPRLQGPYFAKRGHYWQHLGLLSASVVSLIAMTLYLLKVNCSQQSTILPEWYGSCQAGGQIVIFTNLSFGQGLIWLMVLAIVAILVAAFLLLLIRPKGKLISALFVRFKPVLSPMLMIAAVLTMIIALNGPEPIALFISITLLLISILFNFEGMTYLEYVSMPYLHKLPNIIKAWKDFLFKTDQPKFATLLAYTLSSDDPPPPAAPPPDRLLPP